LILLAFRASQGGNCMKSGKGQLVVRTSAIVHVTFY